MVTHDKKLTDFQVNLTKFRKREFSPITLIPPDKMFSHRSDIPMQFNKYVNLQEVHHQLEILTFNNVADRQTFIYSPTQTYYGTLLKRMIRICKILRSLNCNIRKNKFEKSYYYSMKKELIIYLKALDRESQNKIYTLLLNLFNVNFLSMRLESPEIQQPLHKTFLSHEPAKL